jgi:hypothetical protein
MANRITLGLGIGSYESASKPFSAQRCVNLYPNVAQASSLSDFMLNHTPGIIQLGTTGAHKSRGAIVMDAVYYIVAGTTLYSVDELGVGTSRGTILGTARVSMAHNGEKLCIVVPGANGYVYNSSTTTLTQITDPDYRTSDTVCFKDGYYVFTESNSKIFFNSALNDPLTFAALDFGTAEQSPGNIVGCHATNDEVFIFKRTTTEVFQNVGGSGFPFQRIPGASFEKGCHSKYSPIQWEGVFYFIGGGINEKTAIFQGGSGEPLKISTDAISQEIQKFSTTEIDESFSFSYSTGGVYFVGFTFRSANIPSRTFIYNVTASNLLGRPVWFEQQSGISDNAWRINSANTVYDKLLVSDNTDGRVGYLDQNVFTEYGDEILREKITGPIEAKGRAIYVRALELTLDSGQGEISGQGLNPKVMMDFSDDGARTWSSEFWRESGKIGEYFRRVEWRRLGRAPAHRVWRFRISDPIRTTLIKLEAEIDIGK